jgi:chorismate mutase/prephenate dehydratase
MKVAYLGPKGTFTEKATKILFSDEELIPMQPIRNVVMAVESGKVTYGVVPIENFYNGEIRETLDSLTDCDKTRIIKELALPIVHCLGALPWHDRIKEILSKDQALEQCAKYICKYYPDALQIATPSTAEAIEIIKREKRLNAAVIASEKALKDSGFKILAKDLCSNNKTRFVVLGREETSPTGDDKTFLAIHPPVRDRPGVLANIINPISSLGINMEYIQSRPDGKSGYYFYIEINGHQKDKKVKIATEAIKLSLDAEKKYPDTLKILGSYKNTHWKE